MNETAKNLSLIRDREGDCLLVAEFPTGEVAVGRIEMEPLEIVEGTLIRKLVERAASKPRGAGRKARSPTKRPANTSPEPLASTSDGPAT